LISGFLSLKAYRFQPDILPKHSAEKPECFFISGKAGLSFSAERPTVFRAIAI